MSYTSSLYHVIFSTYRREPSIVNEYREKLYGVMANIIMANNSRALIINGTPDHVHLLMFLNPSVSLSAVVREMKSKSTFWAKQSGYFPLFKGWEKEYAAFSLSYSHKQAVYDYISGQQAHHAVAKLEDEYKLLVMKAGLTYYEPPTGYGN